MRYEETMWLPWWWWLGGLLFVGSIAGAILAYVPWQVGVTVTVMIASSIFGVLFAYGKLAMRVGADALSIGRNQIEGTWVSHAEAFKGARAQAVTGPEADPSDLLFTRPYIGGIVRVTIADPADPHAHWVISSRKPEAAAAAINAMTQGA